MREGQTACNLSLSAVPVGPVREEERERGEDCLLCCSLVSCSFLSLSISPSFYQHLLRCRTLLASTAIHHSLNFWPVLCYFSPLDPAKTKNAKTKNRRDGQFEKQSGHQHRENKERKHSSCLIATVLSYVGDTFPTMSSHMDCHLFIELHWAESILTSNRQRSCSLL